MKKIISLPFITLILCLQFLTLGYSDDKTSQAAKTEPPPTKTNAARESVWPDIIDSESSVLGVYSADWALEANLKNFKVEKNEFRPGHSSIFAVNRDTGMDVSVFIEKMPRKMTAVECRSFYMDRLGKSPFKMENLNLYEKQNIALLEYDINVLEVMRNLNAYLSREDYCIDVHISKGSYKKEDKQLFDAIVNSLEIKENVYDSYSRAYKYFRNEDYRNAIVFYEKYLKTNPLNTQIGWRIAVDELGMAYGLSNDWDNAKKIFNYGIKKDPEYPNFYYNLACSYAETSDLKNALINLEMALQRKENIIEGERFPNPRADSSFKNYLKNEQFEQLLKKYKM